MTLISKPDTDSWCPTISVDDLYKRAQILAKIRRFFAQRSILEVETPILGQAGNPDPHIDNLQVQTRAQLYYLQTSPEFHMKRLLAIGAGPIFQICKAFRAGESGRLHNPEFSLLEWYRPGFGMTALMLEVDEFLQALLQTPPADQLTYQEVFLEKLGLDPHRASVEALKACALKYGLSPSISLDRDAMLNLLLSHCIEPELGQERPILITHFPASQAALAQVTEVEGKLVALRFEVYFKGIELANGYQELVNPEEQLHRFEQDNICRVKRGKSAVRIDHALVAAMEHGLVDCAGVALGLDRLIMLMTAAQTIEEVISFPLNRA